MGPLLLFLVQGCTRSYPIHDDYITKTNDIVRILIREPGSYILLIRLYHNVITETILYSDCSDLSVIYTTDVPDNKPMYVDILYKAGSICRGGNYFTFHIHRIEDINPTGVR